MQIGTFYLIFEHRNYQARTTKLSPCFTYMTEIKCVININTYADFV